MQTMLFGKMSVLCLALLIAALSLDSVVASDDQLDKLGLFLQNGLEHMGQTIEAKEANDEDITELSIEYELLLKASSLVDDYLHLSKAKNDSPQDPTLTEATEHYFEDESLEYLKKMVDGIAKLFGQSYLERHEMKDEDYAKISSLDEVFYHDE